MSELDREEIEQRLLEFNDPWLSAEKAVSLSAAPKPDALKGSVTFEGDLLAPVDERWDADL